MITTKNRETNISGSVAEIMLDLETVIRCTKKALANNGTPKELADKMVLDAVRGADMTPKERVKDLLDAITKELCGGTHQN